MRYVRPMENAVYICTPKDLPEEWFGGHAHTHRAMDDARGYAHLLGVLFKQVRGAPQ